MRRRPIRIAILISFFILDAAALALAFQVAFNTRFFNGWFLSYFPVTKGYPDPGIYQQAIYLVLPVWLGVFSYLGSYQETFVTAYDELIRVLKGVLFCALVATAMSFSYRGAEFSRLVIVLWAFYSVLFVYILRESAKAIIRQFQMSWMGPHRVLIIGKGRIMESLQAMIQHQPFVDAVYLQSVPDQESLETTIRKSRISEILMAQTGSTPQALMEIATACEQLNIPCKIVPDILELRRGEIIVDGFLGLPTFRIKPLSLHGGDYLLKRSFDIVLSLIMISVLFIPGVLIAIWIKLDSSGPIFHVQERMGFRQKPFEFYKFRTMVKNADAQLEKLKALSDRSGPVFKMKDDPRITSVGKFLRKYSIDELPQILNVLRGDMSFVGPRPQVLWEAAHYDDNAKKRLRIKPGITGLWQVSGRAALSYEDMINLDIYYLENWSLGLDLKILIRTLPAIFAGQGAY
jgi:exopolysaccharide biosynthesis polyprenyl glycosylphosphotransferase